MKDESRIILNALLAHVSRLVSMAVAFGMVPYLIGHLGEAAYGVIGIAGSILGLLVLVEMGVRPATVRQYSNLLFQGEIDRANALVSASMVLYLGLSVVIVLTLAVFGRAFLTAMKVPPELMSDAYWTLLAAGAALAVNLLTTPYRAALVSQLRHDVEHYTLMLMTFLRAGLIIATFIVWSESLLVWGAATLLSNLVVFFTVRWKSAQLNTTLEIRTSLASREAWRDLSTLGIDTTMAQLSSWVNMQSGSMIVSYFLGAAAVAHYAPVLILMNALISFSGSFIQQLIPVMTKASGQDNFGLMQRTLVRSTRYSILISGAGAAWVAVHARLIVPAWLGPGFEDTAVALEIWSCAVVLRTFTGASLPVFLGSNRLRGIAIFNLVLAAVSLALAIHLVGSTDLGILGAAIPALAAQAIRTVVRVTVAVRVCQMGLIEFIRRSYGGPVLCLVVVAGAAWAVQHSTTLGLWPELAVSGSLSLLAFAATAWTIGLTSDDRSKVAGYVRQAIAKVA